LNSFNPWELYPTTWIKEAQPGGSVEGGKKGLWEVKRCGTLHIYIWRQHNETHQMLFEKGRGEWKYNGGWTCLKYTAYMCGVITEMCANSKLKLKLKQRVSTSARGYLEGLWVHFASIINAATWDSEKPKDKSWQPVKKGPIKQML
jgi:hypothetical protein